MGNSICKFMPAKNYTGNIKTINFVFESNHRGLEQPFIHPVYYLYLITDGEARMKMSGREYNLKRGSLIFVFPGVPFEMDGNDSFKYIYISYMGTCVETIYENFEISIERAVYNDFEHIIEFWQNSIKRINQLNANILSESVLLHTISFINNKNEEPGLKKKNENAFEMIVDYVDNHYTDADISVKKVADIFSYAEKYLSYLFKKNMKIGFSSFINKLRLQMAIELISQGRESVSEIAAACGFCDASYFSKVFKNKMNISPAEYIKNKMDKDKLVFDYTNEKNYRWLQLFEG